MNPDNTPWKVEEKGLPSNGYIPLRKVPHLPLLANVRSGKPLHISTLWRWARRGLRGRKLKVVRVGGTVCTSINALMEFFEGSDSLAVPRKESHPSREIRNDHQQAIEDALDKLGI